MGICPPKPVSFIDFGTTAQLEHDAKRPTLMERTPMQGEQAVETERGKWDVKCEQLFLVGNLISRVSIIRQYRF